MTKDRVTVELPTVAATLDFGRRLAAVLRPGDLLILDGPLGAGKTVLAQGIAAGLGVRGAVTSPTFVIARVHQPDPQRGGRLPMVHVDAYRLTGIAEVNDLDLDTSLEDAVTIVEWGEGKVEQLSDAHLVVRLHRREDDTRAADLVGIGGDWSHRLERLGVGGGS